MTQRQLTKIAALLKRVRKATEQRGKKSELANFLGVRSQVLSDWLSGRFTPGGEITLLMLEWVAAEEAKQPNAPASATNTGKGKTRKKGNVNETKIPSP